MKNKFVAFTFLLFSVINLSACDFNKDERISFKESEYQIHSGDKVTIEQKYKGVKYAFAGEIPGDAVVNETSGEITFSEVTPHYSQVILTASYKELQTDQAIVTLLQNSVTTELTFNTPIHNIIDGDYISVTSLNSDTAITFSLEKPVLGVSIDSMTGRVSYTSAAVEGSVFAVVATSANISKKENYYVTVNQLAKASTPIQTIEIDSNVPATYVLDFSNVPSGTEEQVIGLMNDKKLSSKSDFSYNKTTHTLVVNPSFINTFKPGENTIKIITSRNMISAQLVLATKFIKTASDLQAINKNRESLGGYYVLENDIDLTDYLSKGGEGYNDYRGWNQIGIYHDLENDPTRDSFTGTFDGNGHVISGFFEERADDLAHNEGLFGYVTNQAVIKNVGLVGGQKKTIGRNFIGGFVGFNEGTIKNCWSDVTITNTHEDKLFHSIGAFAGANTGIIDSCFTIGQCSGDANVGAFCGKNYGDITNCYSFNEKVNDFCGVQITGSHDGCLVFDSVADMKAFDFASHFDNSSWSFALGQLPTLKHQINFEYANGLEISNKDDFVFKGDLLSIETIIHPNELTDKYSGQITYSIEPATGSGIKQNGNVFDVKDAVVDEFTVYVNLETELTTYSVAKTFKIYDAIEKITLIDDFPMYIEPGKRYEFNVTIAPSTAPQEVIWTVPDIPNENPTKRPYKPSKYASFNGNVLTISEEIMNYNTKVEHPVITVKGTGKDGHYVTKDLTLNRIHYLAPAYCVLEEGETITDRVLTYYKDSTEDYISFKLPNSAQVSSMTVLRYNKEVIYNRSGHIINIPIQNIKDIPNRQIEFTFRCGTGATQTIYRGYACYIDHDKYTSDNIPTEYIALASDKDFYDHFRLTLEDVDESKWDNYNKTFVLTNDIDFKNATDLVSIGYYSTSYQNGIHPFEGVIYGFGHTIKNASFNCTERYYLAEKPDPENPPKTDPNTNRVGFFGFFQGQVYDVIFSNIKVKAHNYGGCFAGMIRTGGYLENVVFIGCESKSVNEVDYTIDDVVQGRVAATCAGLILASTYDGTAVGLVGK